MPETLPAVAFHDEDWRTFFSGKYHRYISLSLSEAYSKIFKYCVDLGLLHDPREAVNSVAYKDSNDLSDTTSLVHIRFNSIFVNDYGKQRDYNLYQMLNNYYREKKRSLTNTDGLRLKEMIRLCREFENICSVLKLARNVNAHNNTEILDSGFILQICASIVRLLEIFDYQRVSSAQIHALRSKAVNIMAGGFSLSETNERIDVVGPILDDNKGIALSELSLDVQKPSLIQESVAADIELPEIPIDTNINSKELKRQRLVNIRLEIYSYIAKNEMKIENKKTLLYGSNLSDILSFNPKTLSDLEKVLSIEILRGRHPETTKLQIEKFGQKIVGRVVRI